MFPVMPGRVLYLDECMPHSVIPALVGRGYTVETTQAQGTQAASDEAQLLFATARGWVVLTTNRDHFVARHREFQARGEGHAGILSVPQDDRNRPRFAVRCALLAAWAFLPPGPANRLFRWGELQMMLHGRFSLPGFTNDEIALALGNFPLPTS